MPETAVVFVTGNNNKYSIAALAGALESTPSTAAVPVHFLPGKNPAQLCDSLRLLTETHEQLLVCFSFATTGIVAAHALLMTVRAELATSNLVCVAGGPHPTGDPEGTIMLGFDIVVIGEGEETLPELVTAFSQEAPVDEIKGIALPRNGGVLKTAKREPIDLDQFAPFSVARNRLSPIEISRGCPFACRFCQTSYIFGTKIRHRSIDEIVKYIALSKANGTRDFRFISPNALAYGSADGKSVDLETIERLLKAASAITGREHLFFGSFPSEVRPEAVSKEALELITTYAATKMVVIGAQSGSRRMLDSLNRGHTVDDVSKAVTLILEAGLAASVDFIFGLPGETDDDKRLSIEMIERLTAMGARVHSHTFIPLPGTPLAKSTAGVVDEELARYLSRLANKGLQFGQWKKQQRLAEESISFRSGFSS
ncbi:MAG: TIGR04013 family B12-binding domain/radical SAM domain-containing protein [Actinomycetota bacterium]|nr:TIGR04013 family B12-binding domain/radical SAM domain-containing protein [Actinomycetota bacterium]